MRTNSPPVPVRLLLAAAALTGVALPIALGARELAPQRASEASAAAFSEVARVLRHPRCLNCHPAGDRPRVGDEARVHGMNVQRGEDDRGRIGQRCAACHRDENQKLARVPGAPHWHLAPRSMGWEGLDDHDLAETLRDRAKNGDRSLEELREHMAHDPLVLWGWAPGPGRSSIPVSHERFLQQLDQWIEGGAASPAPGVTSTF